MKKSCLCLLFLGVLLLLTACGEKAPTIPCNGVMDIDTGDIFKLGESKEVFDEAFGEPEYNETTNAYKYAGDVLSVEFDENDLAIDIESSGKSNRFEFYDFTFDKPLNEIEGRYEKDVDYLTFFFYTRRFDKDGNPASPGNAAYRACLVVAADDSVFLHYKKGEYVSYSISKIPELPLS